MKREAGITMLDWLVRYWLNPALRKSGNSEIQYTLVGKDKVLVIFQDKSMTIEITKAIEFLRGVKVGLKLSGFIG